jgi:energy-coupling factor transporter ATP-binding protein EcfA2
VTGRPATGTPRRVRLADLAAEALDAPPRLGPVRLVVVDGPSGSGKTTFAGRLAGTLPAGTRVAVVHTDDLVDGWADQFGFWPRLDRGVLAPLRRGRPGRYRAYDWTAGRFGGWRYLPVPDVLIVEGSTTARAAVREELSLSVFLDAPEAVRRSRVLARDGDGVAAPLGVWMAAERAHFAAERPADWVNHLMDGGVIVEDDPKREYLELPRPGDGHG